MNSNSQPGVHVEERSSDIRSIEGVSTSIAAFIGISERGPMNKAVKLTNVNEFKSLFGNFSKNIEVGYAIHQFFENGGREAWFIRIGEQREGRSNGDFIIPKAKNLIGNREEKTGLYALDNVSSFNNLCIPSIAHLSDRDMRRVLEKVIPYCTQRRALLLMDTPVGINDVNGVRSWLEENNMIRHPNIALYFPRVLIVDPEDKSQVREVGPSGAMAGIFARTDNTKGLWKAPAGNSAQFVGALGLAYNLTCTETEILNSFGVNYLRKFPNLGIVCWSARTLANESSESEWKYISVRRLALFIEESIDRGTQWVVFEPNDEPLWAQIRLNVGAFMHDLFRQGAFQGSTPKDAYFVKCDSETTTPNNINRGMVNIVVGFAPLKPAEFVLVRISQRIKPNK